MKFCEICEGFKSTKAKFSVTRTWHDGDIDENVIVCEKHSLSDPEGMFLMTNKLELKEEVS